MKRPFAVVGITYLITQAVAVLCGLAVTAVLFCIALLCALSLLAFAKNRPAWLLPSVLSCAVCLGLHAGYSLAVVQPAQILQGQELYITGEIKEAPTYAYGRYSYIIETDSVSLVTAPQKLTFRLRTKEDIGAQYGDKVSATVQFHYSKPTGVPMRTLLADGAVLTAGLPYGENVRVETGGSSVYGRILGLRNSFTESAKELMGDRLGGMLAGMFTGDTSGIDNVTLEKFRDCGLAHLFAVSGLHLTLLVTVLTWLLRRLVPNYRITAAMLIPFVLFFMAFSGFSMSIRRAGIMVLLGLIAMAVGREADSLNSLGIAALLTCLLNPFAAADAGMLMSFASTLGLVLLYSPVYGTLCKWVNLQKHKRYDFVLRPLLGALASSMVAAVCLIPVTVLCFGEISLISPAATMVCLYPAAVFMVIGALAAALYCIPAVGAVIGFVLFVPAWLSGQLTLASASLLAKIPGAGMMVNYPFIIQFFVFAGGMIALWFYFFGKNKERLFSALLCVALIVQMFMFGAAAYNSVRFFESAIYVFGSDGNVMTALVSGGRCVIIGAGGSSYSGWLASDSLARENINDTMALVLPDNTDRCAGNAVDFIEMYKPEQVFLQNTGRRFELIEQSCRELDIEMYSIQDAAYSSDGCGIGFVAFTDESGKLWIWAECDGLTMLVCPEGGDCALVPDEYDAPDVALMTTDNMINVTRIHPLASVVSAEDSARVKTVLSYRGVTNIFTTQQESCMTISESGEGIYISQ